MTARPSFEKGDRVKHIRLKPNRIGTVIGFSRDRSGVWVRWDGGHAQGDCYPRKSIKPA